MEVIKNERVVTIPEVKADTTVGLLDATTGPAGRPGQLEQLGSPSGGVVKVRKGVTMDWEDHYLSLSERVQELLEKAPDPEEALAYLFEDLESEDRSPEKLPELKEGGLGLIYHNPRILERLWDLVPMELFPVKVDRNDLEAQKVYEEADIEAFQVAFTADLESDHFF